MDEKINQIVIPGDAIGPMDVKNVVRLGSGLWQSNDKIIATKTGILRFKPPDRYYIENNQKRYVAALNDSVIGIVIEKFTDGWKIDIGCHQPALLSVSNFEHGSKRNRANLPLGTLVYARVIVANKDVESECACVDSSGKAGNFGQLVEGYMFKCSIGLCHRCLMADCVVLNELGKYFPYEVVVGANGRIWISSTSPEYIVAISNCILKSEFMDAKAIGLMVRKVVKNVLESQDPDQ